jgi:catechol 2,3-dioxygenase-like lactoylglutathione lyase family enzyme
VNSFMIKGVDNVYYLVSDVQKAAAFYRDILGFKILCQDGYWASFLVSNLRLGLHQWPTPSKKTPTSESSGAVVTLSVEDIDEAYHYFKSRGVKFITEISRNPWGSHVAFEDLDGNHLDLRQAPKN